MPIACQLAIIRLNLPRGCSDNDDCTKMFPGILKTASKEQKKETIRSIAKNIFVHVTRQQLECRFLGIFSKKKKGGLVSDNL